jgi:hypothetical protein
MNPGQSQIGRIPGQGIYTAGHRAIGTAHTHTAGIKGLSPDSGKDAAQNRKAKYKIIFTFHFHPS